MIWKALRVTLLLSLGAAGAYTASRLIDTDALDRHAELLAHRGQPEKAVVLQDVKGIIGKAAAVALAAVPEAEYPAIRDEALRLAREVVEGKVKPARAEKTILAKAAPSCLEAQHAVVHLIRTAEADLVEALPETAPYARGFTTSVSRGLSRALLLVPELKIRLGAATALAASHNPDKPNMIEALETAAKQAM